MDLLEILGGDRKRKEFMFGGKKIVLQTLTQEEQTEIFAQTANFTNTLHMVTAQRVPILARSIVSVENVPIEQSSEIQCKIKEEQKNKNSEFVDVINIKEAILNKISTTVIEFLFTKYLQLKEEHTKEIEDKLKN